MNQHSFGGSLMKARLLPSTLAALSLAAALASPTFAAGKADKAGCPGGFDPGDSAGVRICHSKAGAIRLMTTDPAKSGGHEYTGTLSTDGKFTDVQLIRPES